MFARARIILKIDRDFILVPNAPYRNSRVGTSSGW